MSIVSGAVGGVIILLIITSAVQQRTKESVPQEMPLQMQPPLSSHTQLLGLVPDRPISGVGRKILLGGGGEF